MSGSTRFRSSADSIVLPCIRSSMENKIRPGGGCCAKKRFHGMGAVHAADATEKTVHCGMDAVVFGEAVKTVLVRTSMGEVFGEQV